VISPTISVARTYILFLTLSLSTKLSNQQRARNVQTIINEIAERVKAAKASDPRTNPKVNTWNLYKHFGGDLVESVFPEGGGSGVHNNEANSVNSVLDGITIQQIRDHFIRDGPPPPTLVINIKSHELPEPKIRRSYSVRAVRFKHEGEYSTLAKVFQSVTGATNFAIMEDASTLPITEITAVHKDKPLEKYNFYLIKSIENEADSANKATSFKPDTENVKKYFLKDSGAENVYPAFDEGGTSGNNMAVYTGIKFSSRRNRDGEIDGTYTLGDGNKVEISNLAESSKIIKVANKVMETYIDNYTEYKSNPNIKQKVCLHFPIKKFGDWCQTSAF
jgi:hypothetical protein